MSTASQLNLSPEWKQEVNRRIAAHRNRRGADAGREAPEAETVHPKSGAAARVAARYAKAPTYSEMLAGAVRAAEAASAAALEAQAAAQSLLAGLESVTAVPAELAAAHGDRPDPSPRAGSSKSRRNPSARPSRAPGESSSFAWSEAPPEMAERPLAVRWEPDFPVRPAQPAQGQEMRGLSVLEEAVEKWREAAFPVPGAHGAEEIEVVEPARPIYGNLIEFPRELVATRKMRPLLAEGPYGAASQTGKQLSIFEVDPVVISTQAAPEFSAAGASIPASAAPAWSAIELDPEPLPEPSQETSETRRPAPSLETVPFNRCLMAFLVDAALVVAVCVMAAIPAAHAIRSFPGVRAVEIGIVAVIAIIAALYQTLFFTLAAATPGMRYAGLRLSTFSGQEPTRAERCTRLTALLLSVLPVGIGFVWAIFDEDRLCWHDRLSRTYLRAR